MLKKEHRHVHRLALILRTLRRWLWLMHRHVHRLATKPCLCEGMPHWVKTDDVFTSLFTSFVTATIISCVTSCWGSMVLVVDRYNSRLRCWWRTVSVGALLCGCRSWVSWHLDTPLSEQTPPLSTRWGVSRGEYAFWGLWSDYLSDLLLAVQCSGLSW